jgi:hypothetical protein
MLNVRVEDGVWGLIASAVARSGVSRSDWVREVLVGAASGRLVVGSGGSGVRPGLVHPERALALQARSGRRSGHPSCAHPLTARSALPFREVCSVCGGTVRRL